MFVSGTVVVVTPSEAKKHYSVASPNIRSTKSVRRAYKPHHVGYWVNGIWVALGTVFPPDQELQILLPRWEETGNHKWKAKYNRCVD